MSSEPQQQRTPSTTGIPTTGATLDANNLRHRLTQLETQNTKLVAMLKASRDKLAVLTEELEALAAPPSVYGTFLETSADGINAEVFTSNRQMRLTVSPTIDKAELDAGKLVRLGEGSQIVEVCGYTTSGAVAQCKDVIPGGRAIVVDSAGNEHVVRLATSLINTNTTTKTPSGDAAGVAAGDNLLVDTKAGYAFEVLPRADIGTLALEEVPNVTYADIGGLGQQIDTIHDAIELPYTHPELYERFELTPPRGVLLYGPPGCGKTLIAKAVANSLSSRGGGRTRFINVKGPELLNKYVGETERMIRAIFERARELARDGQAVVVFFDEMESIFRTRGSGVSSDMETTVVPQLLAELDGVEELGNVIVIGATNREELIDPAILRPGRLDVKIRVQRPDRQAARDIFARYITGTIPLAAPQTELIDAAVDTLFTPRPFVELTLVDGSTEVLNTSDFVSGAMIANIVDRAKKLAIKQIISSTAVGEGGLSAQHLIDATLAEVEENEDLPNTSDPDTWSRISGRHGKKVVHARVLPLNTKEA